MKKILLLLFVFASTYTIAQKQQYHVALIGFYNCENFYDTVNNTLINDEEFLPNSERHYNSAIYLDKVSRLSDVISQMGTDINPDGISMLGVSEIENDTVLNDLIHSEKLRDRHLKFVQYNSPDIRGIDVALIYNPKYFQVLFSAPLFVKLPGGSKEAYFTRDVLYVQGIMDGDTVNVFVNHWPSRSGGEERSIPARAAAAGVVKLRVDSLTAINPMAKIVIMGDLNDDPISPSVAKVLNAKGKEKDVKPGGLFNPWI
ncbi:MAG: endonuclease/exonuclease/phosphatase, partial [Ferruginibacter sp.]